MTVEVVTKNVSVSEINGMWDTEIAITVYCCKEDVIINLAESFQPISCLYLKTQLHHLIYASN